MSLARRLFRNRPAMLSVIAALLLLAVGATFTASKVVASGNDDGECTAGAQAVDDGTNDGETADDQQCSDVNEDGTPDGETNDD